MRQEQPDCSGDGEEVVIKLFVEQANAEVEMSDGVYSGKIKVLGCTMVSWVKDNID